jgi:hypothetical protein
VISWFQAFAAFSNSNLCRYTPAAAAAAFNAAASAAAAAVAGKVQAVDVLGKLALRMVGGCVRS